MSLFRKPKKTIRRRVFSANDEEDAEVENMDVDETPTPPDISYEDIKKEKKKEKKLPKTDDSKSKSSLLSFCDDEEEGEVFQVKKSSHSKKVMKMLDRERRKKKAGRNDQLENTGTAKSVSLHIGTNGNNNSTSISKNNQTTDDIQTEIRTDDFVLVVKKSEPENIILNGRAALCAGRDDMSSDDDESQSMSSHRFSKPENFKFVLESGTIPDAAMIHAARKRRQKAREQGDFIPIEDPKKDIPKKGNRLVREEGEDEASDEEERVDMNAITGIKEREERREKFYAAENENSGESDLEMNEWENQQIRKGVTGAQLVTAHQESVLSRFIIKSGIHTTDETPQSTGTLLEQAYAQNCLEKPRQVLLSTQKTENKPSGPRNPQEVTEVLRKKLTHLQDINNKHKADIQRITNELHYIQISKLECMQKAPAAATRYKFYQEIRGYVTDLVECLDEKAPIINDLEKRALTVLSKYFNFLIERRRQDVRDQAKEMAENAKPGTSSKKGTEYEAQVRRAAEREGRRTRRRCEREKTELISSHLDGMSSDDEMHDQDVAQYRNNLDQIEVEADDLFGDTCEEFCKIELILSKFNVWRDTDMESYKDAFVSLCLPKIVGPMIRVQLITWNPLDENNKDLEKLDWFEECMNYAYDKDETVASLTIDPDLRFVPTIIEKIVLPKLTEIIENCWDPMSTSRTLRLIGLIRRLGRDYPSLRESSKPLQTLFNTILDKMKISLENDVFIPIFPKQIQEAKSSFFQRQFCSGLKLFRNILSWQGLIADDPLIDLAIMSLLNRYLLSALRVCSTADAVTKSYIIINTLPSVWLQSDSDTLRTLDHFIIFIKTIYNKLDKRNPMQIQLYDRTKQILQKLHSY